MSHWKLTRENPPKIVQSDEPLITELELEQVIRKHCRPGSLVLDIGAYIGDTAAIFLNLGCEVYAFEAQPDAFRCLLNNVGNQVHAFQCIVGDGSAAGLGEFGEPLRKHGYWNPGTRMVDWCGDDQVSLMIDNLKFSKKVDFVKIDVEGSEPKVIQGMTQLILRDKPKILFECYDSMLAKHGESRRNLLRAVRRLGYQLEVVTGEERNDRCDCLANPV